MMELSSLGTLGIKRTFSIGGLQPISRDTDNNNEMYKSGGRTKGANEKSIVLVHQHGRDDVT